MYLLYNTLWLILLIAAFPYLLAFLILGKQHMRDRLGRPALGNTSASAQKPIWIHAASVGEVGVVAALVPELKRYCPGAPIAVSTTTATGQRRAEQILDGVCWVFVAPLDAPWFVGRVFRRLRPSALLLVETELWPGLIRCAKRDGCGVAVVNGTLTNRGFPRYRRFRTLVSPVLAQIDLFSVQSERAAERFAALGVSPDRVAVSGNVKSDRPTPDSGQAHGEAIRRELNLPADARVVVAGCTREGEEPILLDGFERACSRFESLVLILAPRHLGRVGQIERELATRGIGYAKRSDAPSAPFRGRVLLLDTMGELSSVYAAADVAFVGGSLVPIGGRGHNPLEPAAAGVPVLFGPYMQQEGSALLIQRGAAACVADAEQFGEEVAKLLADPSERDRRAAAARSVVLEGRGAARRTVALLRERGII